MTKKKRSSLSSPRRKSGRSPSSKPAPLAGKVGIFWWHRGRLLAAAVPLEEGDKTDWVIDSPLNHVDYWPQFQRQHPDLRHLEYEDVPRGRVLFMKKTKTFCVYMDVKLHQPGIKSALRREFCLAGKKVRFATDQHYTTEKAALERLWEIL